MGFYDRDYYRTPQRRRGLGQLDALSITTWLILINVAVFVLDYLLAPTSHVRWSFEDAMGPFTRWGYFSYYRAITQLQLWRFLSFQFLHASFAHIFGNMLS